MNEIQEKELEFQGLEAKSRDLLNGLALPDMEPGPYLKTRVMARIEERSRTRRSFLLWRRLGVGFGVLSLLLAVGLSLSLNRLPAYEGLVNKAMLVKLEVTDLSLEDVAYAEVILPNDVEFYSKKFPNLALQRSLRVEWQTVSSELPFVIRGLAKGRRELKVRFYNGKGKEVAHREIAIQFASPTEPAT